MANLTAYERETFVNFNEEEAEARVCTYNRTWAAKLAKLATEYPDQVQLYSGPNDAGYVEYSVPKSWVAVKPPRRISEEQREKLRQQMTERRANGKI